MAPTRDALWYFEIQGSTDMVTKTELIQLVRDLGEQISARNITYYSSLGLIPPAVRVGSRGGAYPEIVGELLWWILRSRRDGLSIEAIGELARLWDVLARGRRKGNIDLTEVEHVAREQVRLPEANRAVPRLVNDLVGHLCEACLQKIQWILKDGSTAISTPHNPLTLSYILAEIDPRTGQGRQVGWTQMRLPGIDDANPDDPRTIVLGIPNGIRLCPGTSGDDQAACTVAENPLVSCRG